MEERTPVRNFVIIGNDGTGKTTLVESMLVNAKVLKGFRDQGEDPGIFDPEPEEKKRKVTLRPNIFSLDFKKARFYIIDTPGFNNFLYEVKNILRYSDFFIFTISAEWGVRDVALKLWEYTEELGKPGFGFVNMIDKPEADFDKTLEALSNFLRIKPIVFQFPVEKGRGIVDLLKMKLFLYGDDRSGKAEIKDIPAEFQEMAISLREKFIENVVEVDDRLMEKYLDGKELSIEEISSAFKKAIIGKKLFPLFCGSALLNRGIKEVMDYIIEIMPSPEECGALKVKTGDGKEIEITQSPEHPFSGFVLKTSVDHFAGKNTFVRVVSGKMQGEREYLILNKNTKEKIGQLYRPLGNKTVILPEAFPGEIVQIVKTKSPATGDVLCEEANQISIPPLEIPARPYLRAVLYKDREAENRGNPAIQKLLEEDPYLHFYREPQTKEFILGGMGDIHLDITIERLKRKFNVDLGLAQPKVPYRETIKKKANAQGKYKRQSGGRGQYGDCWLELEPLPRGKNYEFVNKIVGGVIPKNFIPAVEKGVLEAMEAGNLAGYPVVDVKVTLYDGSYHEVDSSDIAFKIAGAMAFRKAYDLANPVLLEPIMKVEISVPDEFLGAITGDINSRRGKIMGIESKGRYQVIKAEVPMAEMWDYAAKLTSLTQGIGTFTVEFSRYEEVPAHIAQNIIEAARKQKEEKKE